VRDEHKPKTKTNEEFMYLVKKLKHPVREPKPIPRSAGYNQLYNSEGKNPWRSLKSLSNMKKTNFNHFTDEENTISNQT